MLSMGDHRFEPIVAPVLDVFVGMPATCTRNIAVHLGIANGTLGWVRDIVFPPNAPPLQTVTLADGSRRSVSTVQPAVIYMHFPNYRGARVAGLPAHFADTVVPLTALCEYVTVRLSRTGQERAHTRAIKMTQFPLIPALALIPYKLQGATLDALAVGSLVDATYKPPPQAAYIVFSRVRSAASLAMLCDLTPSLVERFKPSRAQLAELVRLHDLHLATLRPRLVVDDIPLFPLASALSEDEIRDPRGRGGRGGVRVRTSVSAESADE
jgi:hypothetical protein